MFLNFSGWGARAIFLRLIQGGENSTLQESWEKCISPIDVFIFSLAYSLYVAKSDDVAVRNACPFARL